MSQAVRDFEVIRAEGGQCISTCKFVICCHFFKLMSLSWQIFCSIHNKVTDW
jgi:hypothetical protein